VGLAVWLACGQAGAQSRCAAKPGDEAAIVGAVRSMYAAATVDDRAKLNSIFAPGFYMFDGGKRFNGDSIMDEMEAFYAKGAKFVWAVTQPDVHVNCDEAWIAYVNQGSVQMSADAAPISTKWLESAVLQRQNGVWRIVFLQSTRVP
jgi:hypothetical protein